MPFLGKGWLHVAWLAHLSKRSTALLGMGMKVLPRRATQYLAKFHFAWHMFLLLGCRLSLRCWVKFRSLVWILDSALCFGW